ncbi:MAG: 3-methyl-2-oxobutanoate hydroxymethyltransferase, partial [Desulfovibrionaceae bacterium]|nr:3-methyl-2-oxobutanoate hydroxymethyltransferase [Desulfovibrionaceae bacterium]
PKFVKKYADLGSIITDALGTYAAEVRAGTFPDAAHSFSMSEEEEARLSQALDAVAGKRA